jgi:hypothetical protein
LNPSKYDFNPLYHKAENFRTNYKHKSITPPRFMKFCPVVPEICRGQVHGAWKERIIIIIIIIRNGAKTISLQTLFGRLNKKRSKNSKSPNNVRAYLPSNPFSSGHTRKSRWSPSFP